MSEPQRFCQLCKRALLYQHRHAKFCNASCRFVAWAAVHRPKSVAAASPRSPDTLPPAEHSQEGKSALNAEKALRTSPPGALQRQENSFGGINDPPQRICQASIVESGLSSQERRLKNSLLGGDVR